MDNECGTIWNGATMTWGGMPHVDIVLAMLKVCGPTVAVDSDAEFIYVDFGDDLTFRFDRHTGDLRNVYCVECDGYRSRLVRRG